MKPANPFPNVKLRVKVINVFLTLYYENVSVLPKKGRRAIFTSHHPSKLTEHSRVICCLPDRQHPQVVRGISIYKGKNSLSQLYFKRRAPPPTAPAMRPNSRNHTEGSASPPSDTPPDVCTTLLVQYQGWCRRRKGRTGPSVTRMEKSGPCHLMTFFKKERKNSTWNINTGLDQLLRLRLQLPVLSRSLFSAPLCNCLGAWKAWSCRQ